jgi:mannose-6-phosphate isomerase-like protein (cupin superfamily)
MADPRYRVAHVSEIVTPAGADAGEASWHAVRMAFGIGSFGVNAYVAEAAGDVLTSEHDEIEESGTRHEELFFVANGHATFTVAGETLEAPAGTFVYVRDPALVRGATAREPGTTLLAIGGEPGKAYEISPWERQYVGRG